MMFLSHQVGFSLEGNVGEIKCFLILLPFGCGKPKQILPIVGSAIARGCISLIIDNKASWQQKRMLGRSLN